MRRESEEEPVEEDEHFDVDEYAAPDSEEIEVADRGTYFEDGDLYVEEDEVGEGVETPEQDLEEPSAAEALDEPPAPEELEAPDTEPADPDEPATGPAKPPARPAKPPTEPKEPRDPIGSKLKAAWTTLLTEAREIELPGAPDTDLKRIGTVAAIALACLLVGAGTYLLGKGSGADVEQAKLEGAASGKQAGAIEGAARGYAAGFRKGQERGFRKAYKPAYLLYYKRAFEQAGLDVPTSDEIEVPLP
jgi:hypothetical protein